MRKLLMIMLMMLTLSANAGEACKCECNYTQDNKGFFNWLAVDIAIGLAKYYAHEMRGLERDEVILDRHYVNHYGNEVPWREFSNAHEAAGYIRHARIAKEQQLRSQQEIEERMRQRNNGADY